MVAALLCSRVARPYGRRGRRIRLSGEAHMERTLRASEEEGRSSILDRSIGVCEAYLRAPFVGERLGLHLDIGEPTPN